MCIAAIAWQLFADKPLVLLSNRDELFARPTAALQHWRSGTVAGQDLRSGGTWLGVRQVTQSSGQTDTRWAIVLNFRDAAQTTPPNPTSRGQLVTEFLHSTLSPLAFARGLALADYDGFNLVLGTRKQAVMLNNRGYGIEVLPAGLLTPQVKPAQIVALSSIAVKPPTLGSGYKATPKPCLHTEAY